MTPRMKQRFQEQVKPRLQQQFGLDNPMAMPRLEKIIISVGLGRSLEGTKINAKARETVLRDLATIAGQKPVMTRARKSVSNFKVRAGYEVGCMVTVRGQRMWEFLDRLITLAIPRIKDFRGLNPDSFDAQGSYSLGLSEQGVFPEVDMAHTEFVHGMNITLVMRNSDPEKSRLVLRELGMPFSGAPAAAAAG